VFSFSRPQLQKIAPEYYLTLKHHTSWCWVIWAFLTDSEVRRPPTPYRSPEQCACVFNAGAACGFRCSICVAMMSIGCGSTSLFL